MTPQPSIPPVFRRLADWVEAYESALRAEQYCDLAAFLPPRGDANYLGVLVELIRINLEHGWRSGVRPRVELFVRQFPEILASRDAVAAIAFEEYRQRLLVGKPACRDEYAARYGVDVSRWPSSVSDRASLLAASLPYVAEGVEASGDELAFGGLAAQGEADADINWLKAGQSVAGFDLIAELGRGAFARVFLARQTELANRRVVLKISDRFPGEAQTIAQLQHTNIVPIYSQHRAAALHILCMPFLGEMTLADALREFKSDGSNRSLPNSSEAIISTISRRAALTRGPALPNAAVEAPRGQDAGNDVPAHPTGTSLERHPSYVDGILWIFLRLAEALEHAHARGVLHRDLKLANVLLRDNSEPMLLDFNLSRQHTTACDETAAVMGGTLPYMAPEQIRALRGDEVRVEARADLFSLGVMLYEMLTGELPFAGHGNGANTTLSQALDARDAAPPPIADVMPEASPAVQAIVSKCLAYDPADRYASAADLAEDLRRQLSHLPLRHAANPSLHELFRKWRRRHPRATSTTAVASIATLVVALFSALWWTAERRLAENDARKTLDSFIESCLDAQFLLTAIDPSSPDRRHGRDLAFRLLATLEVGANLQDGNRIAVNVELLSEEDHRRYQEELADLNIALAAADLSAKVPDRVSSGDSAGEYFQKARVEYEKGHFAAAVELLEQAIERQPRRVRYWMLRGRAEEAQTHYDEAIACYTACVVLKPEWAPAFIQRGTARYRRGQFSAAAVDFDKAVSLNPASTAALVNRALTRQQVGELDHAIDDLGRAINFEPTRTRFYYLRARLHRRAGHDDLAARDEQIAESRDPQDAEGWIARGVFLLPERPQEALAAFEAALRHHPESLEALRNSAHVLSEHLHHSHRAIDALSRAIKLYPDCAPAILGRGVLYAREGRREAALSDLQRGLKLDSGAEARYQAACIFAQTSRTNLADADKAIGMLIAATYLGVDRGLAHRDPDLAPIRNHRDFARIVSTPPATAKAK